MGVYLCGMWLCVRRRRKKCICECVSSKCHVTMKTEFSLSYLIHNFKRTNVNRQRKKYFKCSFTVYTKVRKALHSFNYNNCRLSAVRLVPHILSKVHTLLIRVWESFSTEAYICCRHAVSFEWDSWTPAILNLFNSKDWKHFRQ